MIKAEEIQEYERVKENNYQGLKNADGKYIIKPDRYSLVGKPSCDLILVEDAITKKMGYVDLEGSVKIPIQYDFCLSFESGYAPVVRERKWGIIDTKGLFLFECIYDMIQVYGKDKECFVLFLVQKDGKYGILSETGEIIIEHKYKDFKTVENEGYTRYVVFQTFNNRTILVDLDTGNKEYLDETNENYISVE